MEEILAKVTLIMIVIMIMILIDDDCIDADYAHENFAQEKLSMPKAANIPVGSPWNRQYFNQYENRSGTIFVNNDDELFQLNDNL